MLDPMMEQLLPGFVDECKEIVERVTDHLIELEKAHERLRFDDLARGLHTLKGSAATLGLAELSELAHRMEDAVLPLRGKTTALPGALTDALLKTLDTWMAHLRATTAKSELPDLKPSHKLLEAVRHAVQAVEPGKPAANNGKAGAEKRKSSAAAEKEKEKEKKSSKREREAPAARAEPAPAEPAAEEDAGAAEEAGSWRVRTREVVSLLHEVERLRGFARQARAGVSARAARAPGAQRGRPRTGGARRPRGARQAPRGHRRGSRRAAGQHAVHRGLRRRQRPRSGADQAGGTRAVDRARRGAGRDGAGAAAPAHLPQRILHPADRHRGVRTRRRHGRGPQPDPGAAGTHRGAVDARPGNALHADAPGGAGQLAGPGRPLRRARAGYPDAGGGDLAACPIRRAAR